MASIANDAGGRRRVQFVDPNGDRKTIHLGKMPIRGAEKVKTRVEQLLAMKITGHAMETDLANWLEEEMTPVLAEKLARVGLIASRSSKSSAKLGQFLESHLEGRAPWPRLFHNLRASCETELVEQFPVQAVTGWLGNTPSVAMRHYLMTTEEHFAAAVKGPTKATEEMNSAPDGARTAQNTAQQATAANCGESQEESPPKEEALAGQGLQRNLARSAPLPR